MLAYKLAHPVESALAAVLNDSCCGTAVLDDTPEDGQAGSYRCSYTAAAARDSAVVRQRGNRQWFFSDGRRSHERITGNGDHDGRTCRLSGVRLAAVSGLAGLRCNPC